MTLELKDGGYEKIEARIQAIEDTAWEGSFSDRDAAARFRQIALDAKQLRQVLREAVTIF